MISSLESYSGIFTEGFSYIDFLLLHSSIFFIFILHGLLFTIYISLRKFEFISSQPVPILLVLGFLFSILFNSILALTTDYFGLGFSTIPYALLATDIFLFFLIFRFTFLQHRTIPSIAKPTLHDLALLALSLTFALIMLRNGGLVDRIADSWYHMVLANRIYLTDTLFQDLHHLSGEPFNATLTSYKYRSFWHFNLALLYLLTDFPLPLIWHSMGAWMVVLSILSYYLFTLSLSNSRNIALFATLLFCFLSGGINSYFRVSPWPGNASYILMYLMFYVFFLLLDQIRCSGITLDSKKVMGIFYLNTKNKQVFTKNILLLLTILILIFIVDAAVHMSELLWFSMGIWFYSILLSGLKPEEIDRDPANLLLREKRVLTVFCFVYGFFLAFIILQKNLSLYPIIAVCLIPLALLLFRGVHNSNNYIKTYRLVEVLSLTFVALASLYLIDLDHVINLFLDPAYSRRPHLPQAVSSFGGVDLYLPSWDHQLRPALLYSGILGIIGSAYLFFKKRTRATIFLFSTAFLSILSVSSPYIFTLLIELSSISTAYRVNLLLFHPIIIAILIAQIVDSSKPHYKTNLYNES